MLTLLVFWIPFNAIAASPSPMDPDRYGSLTITVETPDGTPIVGLPIGIALIGELGDDVPVSPSLLAGYPCFTFFGCTSSNSNRVYAEVTLFGTTNANGTVVFRNLEQGYWIVSALETVVVNGQTLRSPYVREDFFRPFIVSVPRRVSGGWDFDVVAEPKMFPDAGADNSNPSSTPNPSTRPTVTAPTNPVVTGPGRVPNLPQTGMTIMGFSGVGIALTALTSALIAKKRQNSKK